MKETQRRWFVSKRFTETGKWDGTWFRTLSPVRKCLWLYLVDRCDQAGVIEADYALASFLIGEPVTAADTAALAENVTVLPNGKLWLPKFVRFQYGILSRDCKPHGPVFAALARHGLTEGAVNAPAPAAPVVLTLVPEPVAKAKPKVSEIALAIYSNFPRKEGRADALRAIEKALRVVSAETLTASVKAYAAAVSRWPAGDEKFVPYASTWFNGERYADDPQTWERKATHNNKVGQMREVDHARGF